MIIGSVSICQVRDTVFLLLPCRLLPTAALDHPCLALLEVPTRVPGANTFSSKRLC